MKLENWIPWNPLKKECGEYYINDYNNSFGGLKIILCKAGTEQKTQVHVSWDGMVEAIRIMNESYRSRFWSYLDENQKNLHRSWPLFIIHDSEFLNFLSNESCKISDRLKFKHYCIMDMECVLDVASQLQPKVELFVNGNLIEVSEAKWH